MTGCLLVVVLACGLIGLAGVGLGLYMSTRPTPTLPWVVITEPQQMPTATATAPTPPPSTPTPIPPTPPPSTPTPESVATSTVVATLYPEPDLSKRPLVFFGPLPKPRGSLDFMNLFAENAPWENAARHVHVFKLYGGWIAQFPWESDDDNFTDDELSQIITALNRRGIAIAFEAAPLVRPSDCGTGIESFFGPEEGIAIVRRIKALGGTVRVVALDAPFAFGRLVDDPRACRWSYEKIARQVDDYVRTVRSVFPDALVGDTEPLWAHVSADDYIAWLDAFRQVTGYDLRFIHMDVDYRRPDRDTELLTQRLHQIGQGPRIIGWRAGFAPRKLGPQIKGRPN